MSDLPGISILMPTLNAERYLEECLPRAEYWDVPVAAQTEASAPARIMEFLENAGASAA